MRGPDNSNYIELSNPIDMKIGFHRLSIMDLSSNGDQPFRFIDNNRTVYTICNGEIYNHNDLIKEFSLRCDSHSDCEVIHQMYLQGISGNTLCNKLEGEFSFIICDINHANGDYEVFIGTDKFGIRPLFMSELNGEYFFSSELKGLSHLKDKNSNYLRFPPRHYLTIKKINGVIGSPFINEYYKLEDIPITIHNYDIALEKIRNSLTEAVISRLMSDRPLGALLSGGLDSSLVCAIAQQHLNKFGKKLRTFSIGIDENATDKYYAELVAKHIGSNHTHIHIEPEEFYKEIPNIVRIIESFDITTVRASTGQYMISKWIAQNTDIRVILTGEASDECIAGYLYFHYAKSALEKQNETLRLMNDIHFFDVLRCDRGISQNGMEARVSFMDTRFIETIYNISPQVKFPSNTIEKKILRDAFKNTNLLPNEVLYRIKNAFSDAISSKQKSWFQIIQEYVESEFSDEELNNSIQTYEHVKPISKESLYYRKLFEKYYGKDNVCKVIPYYWLPRFIPEGENKKIDPSARTLSIYNE